jgi:sporulation protein YlmC with PRC-barrel domain
MKYYLGKPKFLRRRMAGAGVRVFLPGEVLTATLVNTYLQDQVVAIFDTVNARNAAFGDIGNDDNMPELVEGRVCYVRSINDIQYYSGSAWVSIVEGSLINVVTAKGDLLAGTAAGAVDNVAVGTNGYVLVADSTEATGIKWGQIALTGIPDGLLTNAKINASAAIDKTKISGTAITLADSGTVTSSMIANGTIVNADINATAAIELGKLADATIDIKTGNYTLQLTDKHKFIKMNITSTANTVTVPADASVTFPAGAQIHIIQFGTGKTQVVGGSGAVILNATPGAFLRAQYSSATLLKCNAANTWLLMGDLSAS